MIRDTPYIILTANPYDFVDDEASDAAVEFSIYDQDLSRQALLENFKTFVQAIGYPVLPTESLQFVDRNERSAVEDAVQHYTTMHGNIYKMGESA